MINQQELNLLFSQRIENIRKNRELVDGPTLLKEFATWLRAYVEGWVHPNQVDEPPIQLIAVVAAVFDDATKGLDIQANPRAHLKPCMDFIHALAYDSIVNMTWIRDPILIKNVNVAPANAIATYHYDPDLSRGRTKITPADFIYLPTLKKELDAFYKEILLIKDDQEIEDWIKQEDIPSEPIVQIAPVALVSQRSRDINRAGNTNHLSLLNGLEVVSLTVLAAIVGGLIGLVMAVSISLFTHAGDELPGGPVWSGAWIGAVCLGGLMFILGLTKLGFQNTSAPLLLSQSSGNGADQAPLLNNHNTL